MIICIAIKLIEPFYDYLLIKTFKISYVLQFCLYLHVHLNFLLNFFFVDTLEILLSYMSGYRDSTICMNIYIYIKQ